MVETKRVAMAKKFKSTNDYWKTRKVTPLTAENFRRMWELYVECK